MTKPRETITTYKLDKHFICFDGTYEAFLSLIDTIKSDRIRQGGKGHYIHKEDVEFLSDAFKEKVERERSNG